MIVAPLLFAVVCSAGASCQGDLRLPSRVTSETQMVLVIRGDADSSLARTDMSGVAELFVRDLGFAVFGSARRFLWAYRACGNDVGLCEYSRNAYEGNFRVGPEWWSESGGLGLVAPLCRG